MGSGGAARCVLRLYDENDAAWRLESALWHRLSAGVPMARVLLAAHAPDAFHRPFAIYEFVEGVPLDALIAAGQKPSARLLRAIAEALAEIHTQRCEVIGALGADLSVVEQMPPLSAWYGMRSREDVMSRPTRLIPLKFIAIFTPRLAPAAGLR